MCYKNCAYGTRPKYGVTIAFGEVLEPNVPRRPVPTYIVGDKAVSGEARCACVCWPLASKEPIGD